MGGTGMHLIPLSRVSPLLPTSQEGALQLPQRFSPPDSWPGQGPCQLALLWALEESVSSAGQILQTQAQQGSPQRWADLAFLGPLPLQDPGKGTL